MSPGSVNGFNHLRHSDMINRMQESTCMFNRRFYEQKFIVRATCDKGKPVLHSHLQYGIRKQGPDLVMYERLPRLGWNVINEQDFVVGLTSQMSQSSESPLITFAIVHI